MGDDTNAVGELTGPDVCGLQMLGFVRLRAVDSRGWCGGSRDQAVVDVIIMIVCLRNAASDGVRVSHISVRGGWTPACIPFSCFSRSLF